MVDVYCLLENLKISSWRIELAVPVVLWDENIERVESVTLREIVEA